MFTMDLHDAVSNMMKKVLVQIRSFVSPNPICRAYKWISSVVYYTADKIILISTISVAVFFRLTFGIWPQSLNVVPFEVREKENYYEDPGVLEMRALLRGEDCNDVFLDQQQKLPFPRPDYDPYDKIYLASYFHAVIQSVLNVHAILLQRGGVPYQLINSFFLYKNFLNYISSRVAVNIHD